MVNIAWTRFQASMAKDQSGIMDLRFRIQLIIHYSDYLLFYSKSLSSPPYLTVAKEDTATAF